MIAADTEAPPFELNDQFGRKVSSKKLLEKHHLLLLFYPLDWTPT